MAQREEELLPIADVAGYLKKSEAYVLLQLRRRRFRRVIIEKNSRTGVRWTAYYYFDKALWPFTDIEEVVARNSEGKAFTYTERNEQKELRHRIVKDSSGKEYDAIKDLSEDHCTIVHDRSKEYYFYQLDLKDRRNEFWLNDADNIYIPLPEVKAFRKKYGLPRAVNTQKADQGAGTAPVPDTSEIIPEKWYRTSQAARYLGVTQKHLQNNLINLLSHRQKIGRRWQIQGRGIIAYRKKYASDGDTGGLR